MTNTLIAPLPAEADQPSDSLYSREEVLLNFQAMLNSMDFSVEITELGFGTFSPLKRKKATREFKAIAIGLWQLALTRSFPDEHSDFFDEFLKTSPSLNGKKEKNALLQRAIAYSELLELKKDTDFLPAAQYLIDALLLTAEERKSLELKISLYIRNMYNFIFSRLI